MKKSFWEKIKHPILALAPMAGITDSAFRQICRKYGADVVYSEMASVSALFFKPEKTLELLKVSRKEKFYVVQLFGKDPKHFAKATQIVSQKIKPDGIDINFGCPAKKVFSHGSGSALMPQKELTRKIIQSVISNTDLPVSLKIRAGIKNTTALEFIENVKDLDWKALMIHGRTYEGGFSGPVNFSLIAKIKSLIPDRIVLANGGIQTPEDAVKILHDYSNFDGLGIGRGVWGQPWIFEDIKRILKNKKIKTKTFNYLSKIAILHAKLLEKSKGKKGFLEIRKHLSWYFKGFPQASHLRQKLVQVESIREIKAILKDHSLSKKQG